MKVKFSTGSPEYGDLVLRHRAELQAQGVTTLPGLVTQSALDTAVREVESKAPHTTQSTVTLFRPKKTYIAIDGLTYFWLLALDQLCVVGVGRVELHHGHGPQHLPVCRHPRTVGRPPRQHPPPHQGRRSRL